jgi:hypothetical protein
MTLRRVLLLLGVVVLGFAAFVVAKIGPSNVVGMLRWDTRREGALRIGSAAPDVVLHAVAGPGTTRLAQRIGPRPLVLIFGSFT